MKEVIELEGEIVAKGRPRFTTRGGYARTYTPKKTKDFESYVELMTKQQFKQPFEKPVRVDILIKKRPPKSWSKKKQKQAILGNVTPTAKPDLDNYAKSILDGMNGIAWIDDSYIVELKQQKVYADKDGAEIHVSEIDKETAY
jgi:Holliday junction resolvase RusA-like endonuclease